VNAENAVERARGFVPLPPLEIHASVASQPNLPIPDNQVAGVRDSIAVSNSGIQDIEYVIVRFSSADHTFAADLDLRLTSPSGTTSVLAEQHSVTAAPTPYVDWEFGSARHLGEAADGTWTLEVSDRFAPDTGPLQEWQLTFLGF
jgi:kexin